MPHQVMDRPQPANRHRRRGVGEVAGGAAADCTAVCCCCPCTVVNLVVLALYKLPKGLVEKAAHRRRRRLPKKNKTDDDVKNNVVLLQAQRSSSVETLDIAVGRTRLEEFLKNDSEDEEKREKEEGLEKEMWALFAGTGFWRSESQRQP